MRSISARTFLAMAAVVANRMSEGVSGLGRGVRLPGRGAVRVRGHLGCRTTAVSGRADLWDAEDIGNQQVGRREAIGGQPFPLFQDALHMAQAAFQPTGEGVVLCAAHFQEPPGN